VSIENLLQGKSAIVTGAASGIGRATAQLFARQGASVLLADVREEPLNRTVADIVSHGGRAIAVAADIGQIREVTDGSDGGEKLGYS